MRDNQKYRFVRSAPQQARPEQRPDFQVKGRQPPLEGLLPDHCPALALRDRAEIHDGQGGRKRFGHDLNGFTPDRSKGDAKGIVALDQTIQALLENLGAYVATNPSAETEVV